MSELLIHDVKNLAMTHETFDSFDVVKIIVTTGQHGTEEKVALFFDRKYRSKLAATIQAFGEHGIKWSR